LLIALVKPNYRRQDLDPGSAFMSRFYVLEGKLARTPARVMGVVRYFVPWVVTRTDGFRWEW